MQRVAVAAQGTDGEAMIAELRLEIVELRLTVEHRKLAVRVAGIISGAEFHRIDIVALQLLQYIFQGQLRQQRGEYADSHGSLLKYSG
jgi:hypothetical protein